MLAGSLRVSADDGANWLTGVAPSLEKISDLPQGADLVRFSDNCTPFTYKNSAGQIVDSCAYGSSLGLLTSDGYMDTGGGVFVRLQGVTASSGLIPSPGIAGDMAIMPNGLSYGAYIGVYTHLSKKDLLLNRPPVGQPYYSITTQPDLYLLNPANSQKLTIDPGSITYSSNHEWMAARVPGVGLMCMNTADYSMRLFTGPIEPSGYFIGRSTNVPMAITDDGRYVAANTDVYDGNRLVMYDLSTCTDQFGAANPQYCASKDVWNSGAGILSAYANLSLKYPGHLHFATDDSLSFVARYDVHSSSDYKVGGFVATAPGGTQHSMGLLGVGDSYISGEGTFFYRSGTDTSDNRCHVSDLSYVSQLGLKYFNSSNSVACSGAITEDILYDKRDVSGTEKPQIIANYIPGNVAQKEFAAHYKPQAILVSVGGDDIGFSNIVKQCVSPFSAQGDSCYSTYEDRKELLDKVDGAYPNLYDTFDTLKTKSGGARVYVVGYPYVAEPGGDCGDNVLLDDSEVRFSQGIIDYVDDTIKQAAQQAGVFYVDARGAFDGHRLCESGEPAMNGLTVPLKLSLKPYAVESYHPTPYGYQLLAQTIDKQTNHLTSPMPIPALGDFMGASRIEVLSNMQPTGRNLNVLYFDDDMMDGDETLRGDTQRVTVDGSQMQLQPGSSYQIVLHSTPVTLAANKVDADGNISTQVTIPADTEPGYHTVHIYGTDMAGHPVDIQKIIYVSDGTEYGTQTGAQTTPSNGDGASADSNSLSYSSDAVSGSAAPQGAAQVQAAENVQAASTFDDMGEAESAVLGDSTAKPSAKLPGAGAKLAASGDKPNDYRAAFWVAGVLLALASGVVYYRHTLRR